MKIKTLIIFLMLIAVCPAQNKSAADAITGKWQFVDNGRVMYIYKSGTAYYGKLTADGKNIKSYIEILKNFVFDNNSQKWINGQIFLPKKKKYYNAEIFMKDKNSLTIKGSIGIFSKSTECKRIE